MWQDLLVPIDFSEGSAVAFRLALDLARTHLSTLHLLHIADIEMTRASQADFAPTTRGFDQSVHHLEADVSDEIEHRLAHYVSQHVSEDDAPLPPIRLHAAWGGDIIHVLVAEARRLSVDAIVVATHGRRGVPRWFLGSIAAGVVRRADCPVVVVRRPPEPCPRTRHM